MANTDLVASNIGIGLVGFGTVGTGVWETIEKNGALMTERSQGKFSLSVVKAAVRDMSKKRIENAPDGFFTDDWTKVVEADDVDIVV